MSHSFHVHSHQQHLKWSSTISPIHTVPSGSIVSFDLRDGGNNQITPQSASSPSSALSSFDLTQADPAMGPVYVSGAEPGDVLKVEFLELTPADYGWTAILPGFGLLSDEFPEPQLKLWDLSNLSASSSSPRKATFKKGIEVPIKPFLGVVGVAPPPTMGPLSTIPPYPMVGGNMDCRTATKVGCTLYLPVNVPGALFSCGDGHAAQGDGEVCGTAIETPVKATVRLTVEKAHVRATKGYRLNCPHYTTPEPSREEVESEVQERAKGEYAALGIHENIREASRMAVRGVIDWLVAERGLTREEAYMLTSVCAGLTMAEVVDMPNYAISCSIPLSIFTDSN
ncbi:hypothetical protein QBC46DRAFT_395489 [Diplogelasinospora grovesii]|uniref:Formamidase n=1 Tax=Diplogelasinospora grovesii TaxID=303347 RepID=A0AAN6MZI7_9PEZI|nr:hypothetical protein QBC46DRAFT_395489 [Diplogelasinospora grovesii]